ncbi:hypothetical protein N9609_00680 [bacterium]|nr:hypothetical protein [bacterium]
MNKTDFSQVGGFPFETETLERMQEAYDIFQAFGELVGAKSIVKGCIQTSNNVSDGVIYWDGELLPFVGGGLQTKIKIVEAISSSEFEDGIVKPIHYKRHATFGTGTTAVDWTEFKRAYPLTSALYLDKIDMYAGDLSKIPAGWHLCNGSNGTVDLRGRFVVGMDPSKADHDAVGKIGGSETLTPSGSIANRSISISIPKSGWSKAGNSLGTAPSGNLIVGTGRNEIAENLESISYASADKTATGTHNHTFSGTAKDNRPPFYTLAYIQFKGI